MFIIAQKYYIIKKKIINFKTSNKTIYNVPMSDLCETLCVYIYKCNFSQNNLHCIIVRLNVN